MAKMLKTIRFDESDTNVFDNAAEEGEWAVSCAFQFCDRQWEDIDGKPRQAFNNGLLGLSSFGYSTFGSVATISSSKCDEAEYFLARFLLNKFGAPNIEAAMEAAREEILYISQMCADVKPGTIFCVRRQFNADGRINESFQKIDEGDDDVQCIDHEAWKIVEE